MLIVVCVGRWPVKAAEFSMADPSAEPKCCSSPVAIVDIGWYCFGNVFSSLLHSVTVESKLEFVTTQ